VGALVISGLPVGHYRLLLPQLAAAPGEDAVSFDAAGGGGGAAALWGEACVSIEVLRPAPVPRVDCGGGAPLLLRPPRAASGLEAAADSGGGGGGGGPQLVEGSERGPLRIVAASVSAAGGVEVRLRGGRGRLREARLALVLSRCAGDEDYARLILSRAQ
jgi:hypothetical protein